MSQNVHPNIIKKTYLQGHQGPVLCLDHSSSLRRNNNHNDESASTTNSIHSSLLSGSEDKTARLWDLRSGNIRASTCLVVGAEVLSVAFAPPTTLFSPPTETTLSDQNQRNNLFAREYCVYLSTEHHVYAYDLRKVQSPIVREAPHVDLTSILGSTDEVNQISLSPWRKSPVLLAAADDAGTVRIVNTDCSWHLPGGKSRHHNHHSFTSLQGATTLHHDPTGVAIVTSTTFRPRSKGWEIASGGTDCCIHLWDVTKPKRPSCSYRVTPDPIHSGEGESDTSMTQVCNPPMVYSLAWSPSGKLLAAGLGDGTCRVLRFEGRSSCVEVARLGGENGNPSTTPMASVLFPEWIPSSTTTDVASISMSVPHDSHQHYHQPQQQSAVSTQDRLLTSASNDGIIIGWDLGSMVAGDGAQDPSLWIRENITQVQANQSMELSDAMQGLTILSENDDDDPFRPPRILFRIHHGHKPNWMTSSGGWGQDSVFPSTLFVGDTSNDITAYTIPMI